MDWGETARLNACTKAAGCRRTSWEAPGAGVLRNLAQLTYLPASPVSPHVHTLPNNQDVFTLFKLWLDNSITMSLNSLLSWSWRRLT
jgi:hypothetical protein